MKHSIYPLIMLLTSMLCIGQHINGQVIINKKLDFTREGVKCQISAEYIEYNIFQEADSASNLKQTERNIRTVFITVANHSFEKVWLMFDKSEGNWADVIFDRFFLAENMSAYEALLDTSVNPWMSLYYGFFKIIEPQNDFLIVISDYKYQDQIESFMERIKLISMIDVLKFSRMRRWRNFDKKMFYEPEKIYLPLDMLSSNCPKGNNVRFTSEDNLEVVMKEMLVNYYKEFKTGMGHSLPLSSVFMKFLNNINFEGDLIYGHNYPAETFMDDLVVKENPIFNNVNTKHREIEIVYKDTQDRNVSKKMAVNYNAGKLRIEHVYGIDINQKCNKN